MSQPQGTGSKLSSGVISLAPKSPGKVVFSESSGPLGLELEAIKNV